MTFFNVIFFYQKSIQSINKKKIFQYQYKHTY